MRRSEVLPGLDTPSGNEKLAAVLRNFNRHLGWVQVVAVKEPDKAESLAELLSQMSTKLLDWMKDDQQRIMG